MDEASGGRARSRRKEVMRTIALALMALPTHVTLMSKPDVIIPMVNEFLDAEAGGQ